MILSKPMRLFLAAGAFCVAANASTVFNFDTDNLGTFTNFTDTVGGLSATFSSAADPGGFVVYPSIFDTLTGNVLGDPGPAGLDNLALNIAFSQNIAAVTLDFATADFSTPSPLTLSAYEGSNLVGSISATGSVPGGFSFPEGAVSFSGGAFDQLVISSTALDFAVDNISVTPTPEPTAIPLLGAGLVLGVAALRRRSLRVSLTK